MGEEQIPGIILRRRKIVSIAPWKIGRKVSADSRHGFGGRGVGDKVEMVEE